MAYLSFIFSTSFSPFPSDALLSARQRTCACLPRREATRVHTAELEARTRGGHALTWNVPCIRDRRVFTNTSSPLGHAITRRYRERSCHRTSPSACQCVSRWEWFVSLSKMTTWSRERQVATERNVCFLFSSIRCDVAMFLVVKLYMILTNLFYRYENIVLVRW